jgi:hypothetical protein
MVGLWDRCCCCDTSFRFTVNGIVTVVSQSSDEEKDGLFELRLLRVRGGLGAVVGFTELSLEALLRARVAGIG